MFLPFSLRVVGVNWQLVITLSPFWWEIKTWVIGNAIRIKLIGGIVNLIT